MQVRYKEIMTHARTLLAVALVSSTAAIWALTEYGFSERKFTFDPIVPGLLKECIDHGLVVGTGIEINYRADRNSTMITPRRSEDKGATLTGEQLGEIVMSNLVSHVERSAKCEPLVKAYWREHFREPTWPKQSMRSWVGLMSEAEFHCHGLASVAINRASRVIRDSDVSFADLKWAMREFHGTDSTSPDYSPATLNQNSFRPYDGVRSFDEASSVVEKTLEQCWTINGNEVPRAIRIAWAAVKDAARPYQAIRSNSP